MYDIRSYKGQTKGELKWFVYDIKTNIDLFEVSVDKVINETRLSHDCSWQEFPEGAILLKKFKVLTVQLNDCSVG